jgi:hypothetical protein
MNFNQSMVRKGFLKVKDVAQEAVQLWHIVVGAISLAVSVVLFGTVYFQSASAADMSHKEIVTSMTAVHEEIKKAQHDMTETQEEQGKQINKLTNLLELKIQQDKLYQVNLDIRTNDTETFNINQWIRLNGEDAQSLKRLNSLKTEREELILKRNCIANGSRTCQ